MQPVATGASVVPAYSPVTPVTPQSLVIPPDACSTVPLPEATDTSSELSNGIAQSHASSSSSALPLVISLPISYFSRSKGTAVNVSDSYSDKNSGALVHNKTVPHPIAGKKVETGEEVLALVVTIPRDSVRFTDTRRQSFSPISSGGSASLSPAQVPPVRPEALMVTLDRTLLLSGNNVCTTDSIRSPPGTALAEGVHDEKLVPGTDKLDKDAGMSGKSSYLPLASPGALSPSPSAPSGRLKGPAVVGVPAGCLLGVDGCLGANGLWYDWTEAIPTAQEFAVTVLPYVYVDGWDPITGGSSLDNLDCGKESNQE